MLTLLESFLEIHPKAPGVKLGDTAVSLSFKSFKKCDVSAAEWKVKKGKGVSFGGKQRWAQERNRRFIRYPVTAFYTMFSK